MSEIQIEESSSDPTLVEILLKTIGPSRPSRLKLPPQIKVRDLRKLVAVNKNLPIESLKLISRGSALHDSENGEDVRVQLADGDCLIVAVRPKAPPKHLRAGYDEDEDDDEDDLKFQLPESTSRLKWKLYRILHDKLKLPDIILIAIFSLSLKAWALIILWFILAPVAHRWDLGPLYILGTGFFIIFWNLGNRQSGELSAYSIFNEDFRELPGTLNAERLDRDLRTGQL
ncbi:hypothetical protein SOVF_141360 [Spinacia oleracea]|uniref:Ubiquitin-like domain-containing protein n=1 Tax=Spinacia oleracea TaxID=3562 RepID=A0A9R0IP29_SPIOL|nr:uncharacterized protein LOC110792344 [Spinacia oleracea]KNA10761.1 hypothetical protein SOVF_141360 [Spinacia oleracea]